MLAEKAEFPVKMMARVLGVSRSGFYSWLSNGCPREDWSAEREAVRRVWLESDRRFGFRFVKCFLPGEFSGLTLYRVRRLMRELGIRGCTPNARKRTTIPDVKQGILEGLKLRQTVMERQKAKAAAGKTVKKAETPTR